jgi:hypothetical protein
LIEGQKFRFVEEYLFYSKAEFVGDEASRYVSWDQVVHMSARQLVGPSRLTENSGIQER